MCVCLVVSFLLTSAVWSLSLTKRTNASPSSLRTASHRRSLLTTQGSGYHESSVQVPVSVLHLWNGTPFSQHDEDYFRRHRKKRSCRSIRQVFCSLRLSIPQAHSVALPPISRILSSSHNRLRANKGSQRKKAKRCISKRESLDGWKMELKAAIFFCLSPSGTFSIQNGIRTGTTVGHDSFTFVERSQIDFVF